MIPPIFFTKEPVNGIADHSKRDEIGKVNAVKVAGWRVPRKAIGSGIICRPWEEHADIKTDSLQVVLDRRASGLRDMDEEDRFPTNTSPRLAKFMRGPHLRSAEEDQQLLQTLRHDERRQRSREVESVAISPKFVKIRRIQGGASQN